MITATAFLKKGIFYLEKPVTKEEKDIAKVLQYHYDSLRTGDLNLFFSLFSRDALIQSYISRKELISKEDYTKKMETDSIKIQPLSFYDALIRVIKNDKATITASLLFQLAKKPQSKTVEHIRVHFELKKDGEDIWKIFRYYILN